MSVTLLIDIVLILLLVPTLVFAIRLNQRLKVLREGRSELLKLIEAFNQATNRAETGIPKLKQIAEETGKSLQAQSEKGQSLRDDLAFMTDRAAGMVDKLEELLREGRHVPQSMTPRKKPAQTTKAGKRQADIAALLRHAKGEGDPDDRSASFGDKREVDEDERSEAERELLKALRSMD